jgi:ABC-type glycerol-3-phosphate transport system substrate-binding protein
MGDGMKRVWMLAALAALVAALVAGCGGGDDGDSSSADAASETPTTVDEITVDTGPFDSDEEFLAAADATSTAYGELVDR